MKQLITINCPSCNEVIEIDTETGEIERYYKDGVVKEYKGDILKDTLTAIKEKEKKRSRLFDDKLKGGQDNHLKEVEAKFKREREKIKDSSTDDIKPHSPFDFE